MPIATSQRTIRNAQSLGSDMYRLEAKSEGHSHPQHLQHAPPLSQSPVVSHVMIQTRLSISVPRIVGSLGFVAILYIAFTYDFSLREPQLRASVLFADYRSTRNQMVTPPLEPIGTVIAQTELFYMLPPAVTSVSASASGDTSTSLPTTTPTPVVGVLIFFHGCSHGGQDMFRLPEDRIVAMSALERGLAVLSITSSDRETGCWSEYDVNHLGENKVVDKWIRSLKLPASLPRIGMGASSGGSILFSAYKILGFQSMVSYVMPEGFSPDQLVKGPNGKANLPATAFVHMQRDRQTADSITTNAAALRSVGVATKVFPVKPHPFTVDLCDQRLPEIGDRRCHIFLQRVHSQYPDLLDKNNNILQSYFSGEWKYPLEDSKLDDDLRHYIGAPPAEKGQIGPVQFSGHAWPWAAMVEEISTSYGQHEMTCEHRNQVLDFLMKNANIAFQSEEDRRRGLIGILYPQTQEQL